VSDGLSELKDEDIQRLVRLIESLDSSTFDYLQLQVGAVKVTIGKGAVPMSAPAIAALDAPVHAPVPRPASAAAPAPVPATPPAAAVPAGTIEPSGMIEIRSQIMGMFYSQPEPGSPPFVSLGAEVKEDTTVCLIEVMKTFNAMTAGVKGVITEICVRNAQMIEYGQVLFRVRPS
jgi:acetyl-CoA carboxylase biotin carboxyl carrier protein